MTTDQFHVEASLSLARRISIVPVNTMTKRYPASIALATTPLKFAVFPLWT
ncbi:hypothetical protein ACETU7_10545 [Rhodococcus sp. 3Y1]